nr:hypothetical protein [Tanacetum cinerariifolium]
QKADEKLKAVEEEKRDDQAGDEQFLNSPNVSFIGTIQENAKEEINSLLAPLLPASVILSAPVPSSEAFNDVTQRVSKLEKEVKELKQVDHTLAIRESIKSKVPEVINKYIRSTLRDTLQKESAKGKTPSITSKSSKFVSAYKSVHKTKHVVQMDVEQPNLDKAANDVDEPQAYAIPKIPKKDWFKKSLSPETLYLDWNIVKTVDDAQE